MITRGIGIYEMCNVISSISSISSIQVRPSAIMPILGFLVHMYWSIEQAHVFFIDDVTADQRSSMNSVVPFN